MSDATKYSNGFRTLDVINAIKDRVKFTTPTRSDFPLILSTDNALDASDTASVSFDGTHSIVSAYNIFCAQDNPDISSDDFNLMLLRMKSSVILKSVRNCLNKAEYLEKKLMFERLGRQDYKNLNQGLFVGVKIKPASKFDVTCQIDNISLLFDSDVTFNMYLFHDSQPTIVLDTISVTAIANAQTVVSLGKMLSYSGNGNKSGAYYFGYFQNDLGSALAYNERINMFNVTYNFGVAPVQCPVVGSLGINVNQASYTSKTTGFNIQMSAFRDFTQLIVDNAYLFDNIVCLQMAADVIEMIQNTTRTNKDQRQTKEMTQSLYNDLNVARATDELPFSVGLKQRIINEATRVKKELFSKPKFVTINHDTSFDDDAPVAITEYANT